MKRLLVAMLIAAPAFAGVPSNVMELLGTTKDGRWLAWSGGYGFDGDPEGGVGVTVVQDLLTGAQLTLEGDKATEWTQAHPLTPLVKGRASPDKKAVADVVPADVVAGGSWVKGVWSTDATSEWSLMVKRGATQTLAARCEAASSIDVYWTADGKHTVWLAHHSGRGMRDPGTDELTIGTDGNIGVAVAVDKAKLKAAEKIAPALTKAGFTVLSMTAAKKSREKSVVFAAAGHEEEAKKLAAAVPGGAEVQKLDWQSPHDLVVALGPDAVK